MSNSTCASLCSNQFAYEGKVSITLSRHGHKYPFSFHNEGTKFLFDSITKALAGYSVKDNLPSYIDIQEEVDDGVWGTCLKNAVPFTGVVYGDPAEATSSDGRLLLNALLTYDDKRPLLQIQKPRIVILDRRSNVLAFIRSDELKKLWEQITESTEALVEWTMIFKNTGVVSDAK